MMLLRELTPRWWWIVVGMLCMLIAVSQLHLTVQVVSWGDNKGGTGLETQLPLSHEFFGEMDVEVRFYKPLLSGSKLQIVPDEQLLSLTINDAVMDLSQVSAQSLRDWSHGFRISVGDVVHAGYNTLHARIRNNDGRGGISVDLAGGVWMAIPAALLFLGAGLIFTFVSGMLGVRSSLQWIGLAALALVVCYWLKTPFAVRQFDIFEGGGHLDYVRYLLAHHALPPANQGWEYHQPPAYYFTAAWLYRLGEWLPQLGWQNLLRMLSLLYWLVFLSAGLAIIQCLLVRDERQQWYAAVAFCCWPAGFIHALRIGNDVALYAWYSLGLLAVCHWWQSGEQRYFGWAGLCGVLAMLSKASGLALVATLGVLLALRMWRDKSWQRETSGRDWSWLLMVYVITVVLAMGGSFAPKLMVYWRGGGSDWLLGGVAHSINPGLQVANDWRHLLGFDFLTYIQQPWISAWSDQTGRQYFWNYLLRSAISSEFSFGDAMRPLALACGVLLLWLAIRLVVRCVRVVWRGLVFGHVMALRDVWRIMPVLVSGCALLVLLLAYRHKASYASNNDFRYIYPALLTVLITDGALASKFRNTMGMTPVPLLIGCLGVLWVIMMP